MVEALRLLYADPDGERARSTVGALERADDRFVVEIVETARAASDRVADESFDCILAANALPDRPGLELLEGLGRDRPTTARVLLLDEPTDELLEQLVECGVTDWIRATPADRFHVALPARLRAAIDRAQLAAAHRRCRKAIEVASEGIGILDERGQFLSVNQAFASLYGLERSEIIGNHWDVVCGEEQARTVRSDVIPAIERMGRWYGVATMSRPDGDTFVGEHVLYRTADGNLVCTVKDVTDAKERDRRFRRLIDNLPGIVYRVRNEPGWPMEAIWGNVEEITGYPPETVCSDEFSYAGELVHPDDRESVWTAVQAAIEADEPFELAYRIVTATDEVRWVWERGQLVSSPADDTAVLEGFISDITEQKARERELERYETVIETSGDAIYTLDADGQLTYVNDAFTQVTGYDADELLGSHISMVMDPADVERGDNLIRSLLSSSHDREMFEMALLTADGGHIICENHIALLPFEETFRGTVGVMRDITARTQREQQIQVLNRVLRHNVRNELTIVRGYITAIADERDDEPDELQWTLDAIERLVGLSRKARHLDRALNEPADPEPIHLGDLLARAIADTEADYPCASVSLDCPDDLVIEGLPYLEIAILELLENAAKHAGRAPTVTVSVEPDADVIRIAVADDGPGLPPQDRHVLTSGVESELDHGSGLGLWIVYWIVERHRGELDLTVEDGGTTVTITLPRTARSTPASR